MGDPNLVTTCNFHGQEYLFKMNILCNNLEILITDKSSGEEWQCSYDATYIENLTHKTGNFKQFEIFVAMIKSGLLRTSESVTLDLLTFEDLELLRSRKITKAVGANSNNRRYLIVTYVVEFDKIRYPLPMEYCGPPDPVILQATIRRLELELSRVKEELAMKANNNDSKKIYFLQKRIDELTDENVQLQQEVRHLTKLLDKKPRTQVLSLQKAVSNLEKCVVNERNSHHDLVEKLKNDKEQLAKQLEKVKCSERNLKARLAKSHGASKMGLGDHAKTHPNAKESNHSIRTMFKRSQSPICEFPDDTKDPSRHSVGRCRTQEWEPTRQPKSRLKTTRSRGSSSSSTKYADPTDTFEYGEPSGSRSASPSPRRSRKSGVNKSRCSSVGSRTSSKGSSKGSKRSAKHSKDRDYKKLEDKIANLQKMLKISGIADKDL